MSEMAGVERHDSVRRAARWLVANRSLPPALLEVAGYFEELARELLRLVDDGPELVKALDALTDAKDKAVRARIAGLMERGEWPGGQP